MFHSFNINQYKFIKEPSLFVSACLVILAICLFFGSLWSLQYACKLFCGNYAHKIHHAISNPFLGLFVGLFTAALLQSSSMTISIIAIFLSAGFITLNHAVPVVMGANIGTTLTSCFFTIGYVGHKKQFQKAVTVANLHVFFNVFTTMVLFPLEYYFQILSTSATYFSLHVSSLTKIQGIFFPYELTFGGWFFRGINHFFYEQEYISVTILFVMLFVSFKVMALVMRHIFLQKNRVFLMNFTPNENINYLLSGSYVSGMIQSSSVIAPVMMAWITEKKIALKNLFLFLMGTNFGTTTTAFILAIAQAKGVLGLALVHIFFNVVGVLLFFPEKLCYTRLLWCTKKFSHKVWKNKLLGLIYILIIFFLIPYLLIYISWS